MLTLKQVREMYTNLHIKEKVEYTSIWYKEERKAYGNFT